MGDTTLYEATQQTSGTLGLAHQTILRIKRAGVFENVTGDANNLLDTPTAVTVPRENYGNKGTTSADVIAHNHVITFTSEVVRALDGHILQPHLIALLVAAKSKGAANKVPAQIFDALDENVPAFQGNFSVNAVRANVGFADKEVYSFTLTSDGPVVDITSPVAGTGIPIIESIPTPTGKASGQNIVVKGYALGALTAATIGGVAFTSITLIDAYTVVLELPAGTAGAQPIILTNANGASTAVNYTRA